MGSFYSTYDEIDDTKKAYGYIPDHYQLNDKKLKVSGNQISKMKKHANLSEHFPKAFNQKGFNSSTAMAIAAVIEYNFNKHPEHERKIKKVSKMHIYNLGRKVNDVLRKNTGTSIRDTMKQINKHGIVEESEFPYNITSFAGKGPEKGQYRGLFKYRKITRDPNIIKTVISVMEKPILFGFSVYESFHDPLKWDNDGTMPIPNSNEKCIGLQTGVVVGYSNKRNAIMVRNSWGTQWKNEGYFFMPFDYFTSKNCASLWVLDLDLEPTEDFEPISEEDSTEPHKKKSKKKSKRKKRSSDNEDEYTPKEIVIHLDDKCHIKND